MNAPIFKHFSPSAVYGMWGYSGTCCDGAIKRDDPEQAEECWRRGYMDYDTRTLTGTVGQRCERDAPKVAERLKQLGPTKVPPMRDTEFLAPETEAA